ncbi:hypothetical protein [Candidatus Uabimicrobium amorphum]|uniref:DUF2834 domain-containing protein n=1 Tax=Uabimicrobium amorphum TaxID=2596890 RepID=A0A5S9F0T7_UABAM|nr:hypothetical protein [Candidatus Uabimicrobium amorphum]BBM81698.1 hypothetical protein UABAM_00037 [Candidatus Uabimicrobium amorphum]
MKMKLLFAILLIGFGAYTGYIVLNDGYWSVFEVAFSSLPAIQLYLDLAISVLLIDIWIIFDVQKSGKSWVAAVPFILLSMVFGVIGPLVYLVQRKEVE